MGVIKGFNIFGGSKVGKHLQLCGRVHYRATRKNLESRTQLDEPVECASGSDPLLLYIILHLLFFPLVRIIYALFLESRKKLSTWSCCGTIGISDYSLRVEKNYQHGLVAGPLEFQFLRPRGYPTNPFRTLSLCFGVIEKTPGLISFNNFVQIFFVCIGHCDNVLARCDSIFLLLRCQTVWNKMCTQLSLSQILFHNLKNYSLGDAQRFCYHS